jgi:hypothetical protein
MKLVYDVKPCKKIGTTRSDAIPSVINNSAYTMFGDSFRGGVVYGYNLEKQRRKCVHKTKKKRSGEVVKYSEPIRPNQWICYYYAFDYQILKLHGLRVKQGLRTFKLERVK